MFTFAKLIEVPWPLILIDLVESFQGHECENHVFFLTVQCASYDTWFAIEYLHWWNWPLRILIQPHEVVIPATAGLLVCFFRCVYFCLQINMWGKLQILYCILTCSSCLVCHDNVILYLCFLSIYCLLLCPPIFSTRHIDKRRFGLQVLYGCFRCEITCVRWNNFISSQPTIVKLFYRSAWLHVR